MAYTLEPDVALDGPFYLSLLRGMVPRDGIDRLAKTRLQYHTTLPEETLAALGPYFSEHGQWRHGLVLTLFPQQALKLHTDSLTAGVVRRHVVLETNPDAWVYHDGDWQHLEAGQSYTVDTTKLHGAVNFGSTPRTHLFYDV